MTDPLPEDIRQFVLDHVDSIAEMEALVMLTRESDRSWPLEQVVARLYIAPADAERTLERLRSAGLAERGAEGWRAATVGGPRAGTLARLVELYATHLIPITNLIHGKSSRIRQFADAFQLRKKD
ncbi:MAG TPA: hypothetical protein VLU41_07525 [Ideonella sp.]|nr:hypothetical protein [Ideonella sp.]